VRELHRVGFESSVGLTRATTADEAHRVDELVEEFALDALAERPLSSLSYGQARRALIARALANRPRLLLLDEPWEGLDAPGSGALDDALRAVIAEGTQLVCASHLSTHRNQFTHELVLDRGRVVRASCPRGERRRQLTTARRAGESGEPRENSASARWRAARSPRH
jgi:ABC-type molybdenum transport system ATPase subunit/photorepair protein PhrA